MKIARIAFGILYLGGAAANITLSLLNSPASYYPFADAALLPFYREAWMTVAVPHMALFIVLLVAAEITLGLLFLIGRRWLPVTLAVGAAFCLGTVPFSLEVLISNLPLGLIQVFLLWVELRRRAAAKQV